MVCDPSHFSVRGTRNSKHALSYFPFFPPRHYAGDGVTWVFIVALWYTETVRTNLSFYYPTGREKIRNSRPSSNKFGSLHPDRCFEAKKKKRKKPQPYNFALPTFFLPILRWLISSECLENRQFFIGVHYKNKKERKDLPISIGKSIFFSLT